MEPLVTPDGLPLWDTFETALFLLAGVAMGLVLGFLFPSLWRGFRRRMGQTLRRDSWTLSSADLEGIPLAPPWLVEGPARAAAGQLHGSGSGQDDGAETWTSHTREGGSVGLAPDRGPPWAGLPLTDDHDPWPLPSSPSLQTTRPETTTAPLDLEPLFLRARAHGHSGDWRSAVSTLQSIIKSPAASSHDLTRAYLELAQVYGQLGLHDRALALAREYQQRRAASLRALEVAITLARRAHSLPETIAALQRFKGNPRAAAARGLMLSVAHDLCAACEKQLALSPFPRTGLSPVTLHDIETCLDHAEKIAPHSTRLGYVRSLRSLVDALVVCADRPADLWVSFFAELTRLALTCCVHPELAVPSSQALLAILGRLASLPPASEAAVASARRLATREALQDTRWREASEQKSWLAYLLLLQWTATWPHPSNPLAPGGSTASLAQVAEAAFPGLLALLPRADDDQTIDAARSDGLKIPCLTALRVAITANHCSTCGAEFVGFSWACASCGSLETLRPSFSAQSIKTSQTPPAAPEA